MFVFVFSYLYIDSFNIVRQMMAVSIVVAFMPRLIVRQNYFGFLFLVLLVSSIHYYAVLIILALVLGKRDWGYGLYCFVVFFSIYSFFFGADFISYPMIYFGLHEYVNYSRGPGGAKGYFVIFLVVFLLLIFFKRNLMLDMYYYFLLNMMALSLLFLAFAEHNIMFFRGSLYFSAFIVLAAPLIVGKVRGQDAKILVGVCMIAPMIGYFIIRIANNGAGIFPYSFNFSL